ncbi:hypothetical protein [Thalassospira povalilytica]|uniref:hypothetical protein n=1 Tax=Thalassospira povalilytica TaxID=732237 RepID=UPI003AA98318
MNDHGGGSTLVAIGAEVVNDAEEEVDGDLTPPVTSDDDDEDDEKKLKHRFSLLLPPSRERNVDVEDDDGEEGKDATRY